MIIKPCPACRDRNPIPIGFAYKPELGETGNKGIPKPVVCEVCNSKGYIEV